MSFKENKYPNNNQPDLKDYQENSNQKQVTDSLNDPKINLHQKEFFAFICEKNFTDNTLENICTQVAIKLNEDFGSHLVLILKTSSPEDDFEILSAKGFSSFHNQSKIVRNNFSQANYSYTSENIVYLEDLSSSSQFPVPDFLTEQQAISGITLPIAGENSPFGVLCVFWKDKNTYNQQHEIFLESTANLLATVIEKKLYEQELRISEQSYKSLFDNNSDLIYITDEKGYFLDVNQAVVNLHGYDKKEIIGNTVSFLSKENHSPSGYIEKYWENDTRVFEWAGQKKNGETFIQELSVRKDIYFGKEVFIISGKDITERKQAEAKIKEGEEKYLTLLENLNDAVLYTDSDLNIQFANKRLLNLTLFSINELEGKNITETLIENDTKEDFLNIFHKSNIIKTETETALRNKNNDIIDVHANIVSIKDGNLDGFLMTFMDITEKKAAEAELEVKTNDLNNFLYKLSHDLKGPLTSIQGLINIATDELKDPSAMNYLDMFRTCTDKLETILSDLSDLTRIQVKKIELTPVNISDAVNTYVDYISGKENAYNVNYINETDKNLAIESDINIINIILGNLIKNAVIFRKRNIENPYVKISSSIENKKLILKIEDNGIGIAENHIYKIYDMFFKGSMYSTGTGMGLFLVKNAVKKIKGKITINSTVNEGTAVIITLPLKL